jgi:hypothetical protein
VADLLAATAAGVAGVLLELTSTALTDCGSDPVEQYVAAGAIAWDNCCGMLVAAPERIYRTGIFPEEGSTDVICETGELTCDMLVLLLRCVPVLDDRGQAPTTAAMNQAYTAILRDAAIIWNALTSNLPEGWMRANVNQLFLGAEGGCIGCETRLTIGLPQEDWCTDC